MNHYRANKALVQYAPLLALSRHSARARGGRALQRLLCTEAAAMLLLQEVA